MAVTSPSVLGFLSYMTLDMLIFFVFAALRVFSVAGLLCHTHIVFLNVFVLAIYANSMKLCGHRS